MEEIAEVKSASGLTQVPDEWIMSCLNNRGKHLYSQRGEGPFLEVEGRRTPLQFMQATVEFKATDVFEPEFYAKKLARFYNHCVKENLLNYAVIAPMSYLECISLDLEHKRYCRFDTLKNEWQTSFISQPSGEAMKIAALPFNPEFITRRVMFCLYGYASLRTLDIAGSDSNTSAIVNTLHELSGVSSPIFYREGEMAEANNIWNELT
jgi:hypothetical protein